MTTDNLPARLVPPLPGETGRSHWEVTPLGTQMVEELASRGCHVATIARALGMDATTFRACRTRQPEVDEAYHRGLAREHDALVGNLRTLADGGNVVANLFLLKARHGYREGEPPELNVNVSTGGVVVVPQRQTMEEFLQEAKQDGRLRPPDPLDLTPERLAEAYGRLFPRRLQLAHLALIAHAEQVSPDGWPTPPMVAQFSRMYRVPRERLGGLVGLLCRRPPGAGRDVWTDALREPERATPHLIQQHSRAVQVALGWCLHSLDLWMRRPLVH